MTCSPDLDMRGRAGQKRLMIRGAVVVVGLLAYVAACTKPQPSPPPDAAATTTQAVLVDAGPPPDAALDAAPDAAAQRPEDPFGSAKISARAGCMVLVGKVSRKDVETSFVDGNDLLALVNRSPTGTLPPDYVPPDLVDIQTNKAVTSYGECEKVLCLRDEAASALTELLGGMKTAGFPGKVESAYRSYNSQCATFGNWARRSNFCDATEQSALPGHSQHQLGTTVDIFSEDWVKDGKAVFRDGFGCTDAGRWLREHATDFGFVMPYPLHPDDRHAKQKCTARWDIDVEINPKTGYRYEHWHIRYVGKDAAARFKAAFEASPVGKPQELTVEQWLRSEKGMSADGDTEIPVCDGCNCGACGTLAEPGKGTCDRNGGALHLDAHGRPLAAAGEPTIVDVAKGRTKTGAPVVEVKLDVPPGLATQPPLTGASAAAYSGDATFEKLDPFPETDPRPFAPLPGTWMVAVEPVPNDTRTPWPYRAALTAAPNAIVFNRADVVLPAHAGATTIRIPIPSRVTKAKVVVLEDGVPHGQERAAALE